MSDQRKDWYRIRFAVCDLCTRRATWQHPLGGLRCDRCPRP